MKARNLAVMVGVAVAALCMVMAFGGLALAEDAVKVTGKVSVAKDDDGNITAVKITAGETVNKVVLDDNGKKLGAEMDGKKVEATGTFSGEDDAKVFKVESFKEVKEAEE